MQVRFFRILLLLTILSFTWLLDARYVGDPTTASSSDNSSLQFRNRRRAVTERQFPAIGLDAWPSVLFSAIALGIHYKWHNEVLDAVAGVDYRLDNMEDKIDVLLERSLQQLIYNEQQQHEKLMVSKQMDKENMILHRA